MNALVNPPTYRNDTVLPLHPDAVANAWAVDASCPGNPGPTEYQCIDLQTGEQVFHFGPFTGTNNIGEFLAIVHALALMEQRGIRDKIIYTDSMTAKKWVMDRMAKSKLKLSPQTQKAHELVKRGEMWLRQHPLKVQILKWDTRAWGEIPADFGRKK